MNFFSTYWNKVTERYYLHRFILPFIQKNQHRVLSRDNTISLFSFPRSGSTWLSEILLEIPNSCLFDEPLQRNPIRSPNTLPEKSVRKVKEVAEAGFYYFQPVPEGADNPEFTQILENILKGQAVSVGLYNDYGLSRLNRAEVYITKFLYGSLLSSWLLGQFDLPALFLVRNPYSCIASILRHPLSQRVRIPDRCEVPVFRYNEVFKKYDSIYRTLKTREEYFTFLWCLSFREGPDKNKGGKNHVIFYEDLLLDFRKQIEDIFRYLNKSVPVSVFQLQMKPSLSSAGYASEAIRGQRQIDAWKGEISGRQSARIRRILEEFGIEVYKDTLLPDHKRFYSG